MQAIERAFAVLRALGASNGSAGVSAVSRETGLPKSTVSRLLASLEAVGAVERIDAGGSYAIGPALSAIAGEGSSTALLREVARSSLRQLVDDLGESAGLSIPDGSTALYVDHVGADGSVQTRDWTGMRFPFHTVAGGLAMMTTWSNKEVERYAAGGLEQFTAATVTTPAALQRKLTEGRRRGYTWTLGEFDVDINGIGAPIRNPDGRAIGAINVYGPSYRYPGDRDAAEIGELVRTVARTVQDRLYV